MQSVDLVADPATTRGLFEATEPDERETIAWDDITIEELQARRPDLIEPILDEAQAELTRLKDEVESLQALEDERQSSHSKPRSRDQHLAEAIAFGGYDAASFVRSIT